LFGPAERDEPLDGTPLVDRVQRLMRQCLGERSHGAAIFSTVNDEDCNLLKVSRDGLLDAPVPGVDDVAVAPVTFGSHYGRLDDADRLDRGEQQGVRLGIGLGVARLVGVLLQRAWVDESQFHSDAPLREYGPPSRPAFIVFFPKTPS